jgi:2-succinyl-5-enolpyruvyl-6-hydroxy-3-cyclohexene-1-carboxylate synthase
MNGLLMAKKYGEQLNLTIVVINNDGGGIFSFLPQKSEGAPNYEDLWGTPHGLSFRSVEDLYGVSYTHAGTAGAYEAAIRSATRREGVDVIEVPTKRDENLALHNRIWAAVAGALRS